MISGVKLLAVHAEKNDLLAAEGNNNQYFFLLMSIMRISTIVSIRIHANHQLRVAVKYDDAIASTNITPVKTNRNLIAVCQKRTVLFGSFLFSPSKLNHV